MRPIDIIILTYNRLNYLKKTLKSINENTKYPYRLIAVDNASTDILIKRFLEEQYVCGNINKIIVNKTNLLLDGWREGLEEVTSNYFAISDPDIIVPESNPCWLTQLVTFLDEFPRIVRVGLSLDTHNVPPCWSGKQGRKLAFKTGPYFNREHSLRIADVDTTMQLIRTEPFKKEYALKSRRLDRKFWIDFHNSGISVAAQNITGYHLGWNEYKEDPEYLLEKCKKLRYYPEAGLIEKKMNRL